MNKYTSTQRSGELIITWKTGRLVSIIFLVFSIFWLFISSIIYVATNESMLFLFMLIGAFVFYLGLANLINRYTLTADRHDLRVKSGPLPWFGNKDVKVSDIDQLYVMDGGQEKSGSKTTSLYMLRAKMRDNKQVVLIQGIRSKEMALELEHKIEQHLNITDRALPNVDHPRLTQLKEKFPVLKDLKLPGPINDGKPGAGSARGNDNTSSSVPARLIEGYAEMDVHARRLGEPLQLINQRYELIRHEQLDWSDGRTDLAFDLRGGDGSITYLYAEHTDQKYLYFEERLLDKDERELIGFPTHGEPPGIIENGDQKYYRRNEVDGFLHVDHGSHTDSVGQWIYFTTVADDRFRVLQKTGELEIYIQEPLPRDNVKVLVEDELKRRS